MRLLKDWNVSQFRIGNSNRINLLKISGVLVGHTFLHNVLLRIFQQVSFFVGYLITPYIRKKLEISVKVAKQEILKVLATDQTQLILVSESQVK